MTGPDRTAKHAAKRVGNFIMAMTVFEKGGTPKEKSGQNTTTFLQMWNLLDISAGRLQIACHLPDQVIWLRQIWRTRELNVRVTEEVIYDESGMGFAHFPCSSRYDYASANGHRPPESFVTTHVNPLLWESHISPHGQSRHEYFGDEP